jgi:hypothetical protein
MRKQLEDYKSMKTAGGTRNPVERGMTASPGIRRKGNQD